MNKQQDNDNEDTFSIKKNILTHDDLEEMDWHDANIHGLVIHKNDDDSVDLLLDIDFIFKWGKPKNPTQPHTFWVAPCTVIFKESFDLRINIDNNGESLDLMQIDDLYLKSKVELEKSKYVFEWNLELHRGWITLKSYGLEQIVRQLPILVQRQNLSMSERGGVSFLRNPIYL